MLTEFNIFVKFLILKVKKCFVMLVTTSVYRVFSSGNNTVTYLSTTKNALLAYFSISFWESPKLL